VRRAARALTDLYDDALAPVGLKVTQFSVLRTVQRLDPVSISVLADEMALDRSTLGRNLQVLARRGLVVVTEGEDLRTRTAALTPHGEQVLGGALPLWEAMQQRVRRQLGADRVAALFEVLEQVEALRP
jgi:DNA-binding MarR family transcriptional regulator